MGESQADIGLIGLGVMGRNLALNAADHGFGVVGMDRDDGKVRALTDESGGKVDGVNSVDNLVARLKSPRVVLLLVPAGRAVDSVIDELKGRLDRGDTIADGGNSHFTDTNRRTETLADDNIHFLGVGVSGGSEGARHGPSIMPGGPEDAYERIRPVFEAIAAQVDDTPCVTYLGPRSAGHYVKMVHNGIEYALMQLIAEAYDILRRIGQLSNDDVAGVFENWNHGPLNSFLIEITSKIPRVRDDETDQRLIDVILDAARQKGTGKWTSQDAMELQTPVPTIDVAVGMRDLSAYKTEREEAAGIFPLSSATSPVSRRELIDRLEEGLRFAMITAYAQGMALLRTASREYKYDLRLGDIARIWRGGCIIRAAVLDDIRGVFEEDPDTANLMTKQPFSGVMKRCRGSLCEILRIAFEAKIPAPALASVLTYFDAYRTPRLPSNMIQAQRDFFGSHTYERIDREGTFHTDWANREEIK